MSPTDKGGDTPESPKTPEPYGDHTPSEAAPVDPITGQEAPGQSAADPTTPGPDGVDMTKPGSEPTYGEGPVPGAPIGGAYPAPESFASASPAKNRKVIAIIAGVLVAVIAVVAVLLVITLKEDVDSPEAEIKQVTQDYVDAVNAGEGSKVPDLLCEEAKTMLPPNITDQDAPEQQAQIDAFDELTIDGDTATSTFTLSAKDDESIPTEQIQMTYVNEDGWKLCP